MTATARSQDLRMKMSKQPFARTAFAVVLILTWGLMQTSALFGQSIGRIGGTVTDPAGAVVPAVRVSCKSVDTGIVRTAETNQSGVFEIPDLPIGNYSLEFRKQGFQTQNTDPVQLVTGQVVDLKIALRIG